MKDLNHNIEFSYLYRDAGNYKISHKEIFANPENLKLSFIEEKIKSKLTDGEFFNPVNWGLHKPSFEYYEIELDHEWCEFISIDYTTESCTMSIPINAFLIKVEDHGML